MSRHIFVWGEIWIFSARCLLWIFCEVLLVVLNWRPVVAMCVMLWLEIGVEGAHRGWAGLCRRGVIVCLDDKIVCFCEQCGMTRMGGQFGVRSVQGEWPEGDETCSGCEALLGVMPSGPVVAGYVMLCLWFGGGGAQWGWAGLCKCRVCVCSGSGSV